MLQSHQQEYNYVDYQMNQHENSHSGDSSDGIGSSLSSSPAPSLTESSPSNSSSPNKFAYSTPYMPVNQQSLIKPEQYYQQPPAYNYQQFGNKFNQNQYNAEQLYNYQQIYLQNNRHEYPNNSLNDSCYQSKNNSINYLNESIDYKGVQVKKPVINSLTKFSIDAILAKPTNLKTKIINTQVKPEITVEIPVKEKGKRKKRTLTNELETSSNNKRIRTIFTQEQLDKLEVEFLKQQYMVGSERTYLANSLNLSESQVKIWFQNRRIKWRKTTAEEQQQERDAHMKKMANLQYEADDDQNVDESHQSHSNDSSISSYDDE